MKEFVITDVIYIAYKFILIYKEIQTFGKKQFHEALRLRMFLSFSVMAS